MAQIVITHPEMGIYLGNFLGLGFWTKLDVVGQEAAVIFPSEEDARKHISSWVENNDPNAYSYIPVKSDDDHYANIETLKEAGLSDMLGYMEVID